MRTDNKHLHKQKKQQLPCNNYHLHNIYNNKNRHCQKHNDEQSNNQPVFFDSVAIFPTIVLGKLLEICRFVKGTAPSADNPAGIVSYTAQWYWNEGKGLTKGLCSFGVSAIIIAETPQLLLPSLENPNKKLRKTVPH
jgi:hypothetical protein